ncbi:MAG TPA: PAC2 family protein [Chloroflexota bacterium]|nr:PAC2 family protein [Chloroflexota bacterium]
MSDSFIVHDWPYLRRPVLISAFKGWNDAAEAASAAVQFMIDTWSARSIASLDAEEFYDFTETRPRIRLVDDLSREIEWPGVELYAHIDPESAHDLVLMVGQEPQLHWRTFVGETIAIAERLGIVQAVLLGALLADVPHTRPVRITGSTPDPGMYAQLEELGVSFSRYEGPTGMVGVLQDACNRRGMPAASLWGNVPHYITASPNPQVSVALLQHLDRLLDLGLSLRLLEVQAQRFRRRVDEAISHSPEALTYVRELEGRDAGDVTSSEGPSQLPSGPEVVRALEEYLRQQRNDEGEE